MTSAETAPSNLGHDAAQRTTAIVLDAAPPSAAPDPDTLESALAQLASLRDENENLKAALRSNREIGVATGILMAQHHLTKRQAFERLRETSQHTHRKLRDVASEVLFTGTLPPETVNRMAAQGRSAKA